MSRLRKKLKFKPNKYKYYDVRFLRTHVGIWNVTHSEGDEVRLYCEYVRKREDDTYWLQSTCSQEGYDKYQIGVDVEIIKESE